MILRLIALAIGYAFGIVQSAYIYGKLQGIDIREYGSGNAGTTNALRVMGKKAGLIVLLMDAFKAIFAITIVTLLFGKSHPEMVWLLKMYAIAGTVLGHDYPFYMGFKGGKGVAVMAGFVLSFHWTFFPVALIVFFGPFLVTHYVSLGSLILYAACPILLIVEGQAGFYAPTPQGALIEMYVIMIILTVIAYSKHSANIGRLLRGEERKTYVFKKDKQKQ